MFFFGLQPTGRRVGYGLNIKANSWVPSMTSGCVPIQGAGVHVAECGGCALCMGAGFGGFIFVIFFFFLWGREGGAACPARAN